MKSIHFKVFLIFLITVNVTAASCQPERKADESIANYMSRFRVDYSKSIVQNKPESLQPYYADTVRLMPAFQKTIIGKRNTLLYQKAFLSRFSIHSHERKPLHIVDLGAQVMEIGTFKTHLTFNADQSKHDVVGKYMTIWLKMENGNPSLITEAWNYDQYYGELQKHLGFAEIPSLHAGMLPNVAVTNSISFELAAMCRLLDVAVTQHDAATWSMFYADDSILLPNYEPVRNGKKQIDEYINEHVKGLPIFEELDIRNDRIDDLNGYVVEYASHIASWRNSSGSGVNFGKNIRVWRREPDHSLKVLYSIGMYD